MRPSIISPLPVLLLLAALAAPAFAAGYRLAPWKDELFDYPRVTASAYGGDYVAVDYVESRDLYARDIVPEEQTRPEYVSLDVRASQRDMTVTEGRTTVHFIAVGRVDGGARAVVMYVHGRGGDRFQGANDGMFGGNFNRIKNLMARNDGVYLSPGFRSLNRRGADEAALLVRHYAANSPGAPIFIACGSLGGRICWALAADPEVAPLISGLLLMGSTSDEGFFQTAAFRDPARRFPIYIGHGTRDRVINWRSQEAFFQRFKELAPDYPIKFALFETGSHGTPIRMTDWRLILNWMLDVNGA